MLASKIAELRLYNFWCLPGVFNKLKLAKSVYRSTVEIKEEFCYLTDFDNNILIYIFFYGINDNKAYFFCLNRISPRVRNLKREPV